MGKVKWTPKIPDKKIRNHAEMVREELARIEQEQNNNNAQNDETMTMFEEQIHHLQTLIPAIPEDSQSTNQLMCEIEPEPLKNNDLVNETNSLSTNQLACEIDSDSMTISDNQNNEPTSNIVFGPRFDINLKGMPLQVFLQLKKKQREEREKLEEQQIKIGMEMDHQIRQHDEPQANEIQMEMEQIIESEGHPLQMEMEQIDELQANETQMEKDTQIIKITENMIPPVRVELLDKINNINNNKQNCLEKNIKNEPTDDLKSICSENEKCKYCGKYYKRTGLKKHFAHCKEKKDQGECSNSNEKIANKQQNRFEEDTQIKTNSQSNELVCEMERNGLETDDDDDIIMEICLNIKLISYQKRENCFKMDIENMQTIKWLKQQLPWADDPAVALYFNGTHLVEEEWTLKKYGVENNATILCIKSEMETC